MDAQRLAEVGDGPLCLVAVNLTQSRTNAPQTRVCIQDERVPRLWELQYRRLN